MLLASGAELAAFAPEHRHAAWAPVGAHTHPAAANAAAATAPHCDTGPVHTHAHPQAESVSCTPGHTARASVAADAIGATGPTLPAAGAWTALGAPPAAATRAHVAALESRHRSADELPSRVTWCRRRDDA
ncbi:MAG: hypothetical protein EXR63_05545 [Dehalococcoidia bacterium]|nr:hypothetical protein [Dehalococcoidia bacterium]